MNHTTARVGILGAGTWGIALASMLCKTGKQVTVWSRREEKVEQLQSTNTHPKLPGITLPAEIIYTTDIRQACREQDILLFAVPSVYVRSTARAAKPYIPHGQIIVDVAKGIEADSLMTLTEVLADELQDPSLRLVALSGPTHAEEVAAELPTTIVSACRDLATAEYVQQIFSSPYMRVYTNTDIRGTEICGALKNIIALATGISTGLGYGDNARAALITRGLAELSRLGTRLGCTPQTFSGLTGMGDLIVTCTSRHSRNNRCGFLIGQGVEPAEAVRQVGMVVEGINALPAAMALAQRYQVEIPIISAVDAVVNHGLSAHEAVDALFTRELKGELPKLEF